MATKFPGKPLQFESGEPLDSERLYQLTYISHRGLHHRLLYIKSSGSMPDLIERVKNWCSEKNWRFVYLESAIEVIE